MQERLVEHRLACTAILATASESPTAAKDLLKSALLSSKAPEQSVWRLSDAGITSTTGLELSGGDRLWHHQLQQMPEPEVPWQQ